MKRIGIVLDYLTRKNVAIVQLERELKQGDPVHISKKKGKSFLFQFAESIEIEHKKVIIAEKGTIIGLQVEDRVRPNDRLYLVNENPTKAFAKVEKLAPALLKQFAILNLIDPTKLLPSETEDGNLICSFGN